MATQADVRRIALSLPGTEEEPNRFAFSVRNKGKLKGFVWVWLERIHPKKARVPQPRVIAIRTASLDDKEFLLGLDGEKFFTEPHYNGYPAVMVRLEKVTARELRALITEAWRCQAPRELDPKRQPVEDLRHDLPAPVTAPYTEIFRPEAVAGTLRPPRYLPAPLFR